MGMYAYLRAPEPPLERDEDFEEIEGKGMKFGAMCRCGYKTKMMDGQTAAMYFRQIKNCPRCGRRFFTPFTARGRQRKTISRKRRKS